MRIHWLLRAGESIEIYDGMDGPAKDKVVVYRIGIERLVQGELKIVRPIGKAKIINKDSRATVIDVATSGALFVEVIGTRGLAYGWYEAVFAP